MTSISREAVLGCWLGKAIGGTLGQPFEGLDGPLAATFYEPVPTEMVPNDDLDLQVVWACVLAEQAEPSVTSSALAAAWTTHVEFPFNEYGVAKRNLREGILPPFSGSFDNWFTKGEGAAIRSEIWACLAPSDPATAAEYAYRDACVDHAGDGIFAPMFLAALQSRAFSSGTVDDLLDAGLSVIPRDSGIAQVVIATRTWFEEFPDWRDVRSRILSRFESQDFTDVLMNTGFVVLGLLAGRGDFAESILITSNCGKDTDSSAASVGATLGILSPASIPREWLAPIGSDLVLSPGIVNLDAPATIEEFTDLVLRLRERVTFVPREAVHDWDPRSKSVRVTRSWSTRAGELGALNDWFMPPSHAPAPELAGESTGVELEGTWSRLAAEGFENDLMLLRYPLDAREVQNVRVMVASNLLVRVWLDGNWLFGRDGGEMFPAPHMPRLNTFADVELSEGPHELTVVLHRPEPGHVGEWVVAIADSRTKEWIPDALRVPSQDSAA
ncbi:ADP-ribosylglycohydrolase family protein [Streptomyces sp. NPDC007164]|uniref:ADP-ribosylglycohydrolase family protein n=1 Tax=Streptomyces sp. NPDC007164 TaxID=3156918 RepID=UPI003406470E